MTGYNQVVEQILQLQVNPATENSNYKSLTTGIQIHHVKEISLLVSLSSKIYGDKGKQEKGFTIWTSSNQMS